MSADASRPAGGRWCDVNGTQIPLFCQVEQVVHSSGRTLLPFRLHEPGQVVGRGLDAVYVCFPGNHLLSVRPQLLRVLDDGPGGE